LFNSSHPDELPSCWLRVGSKALPDERSIPASSSPLTHKHYRNQKNMKLIDCNFLPPTEVCEPSVGCHVVSDVCRPISNRLSLPCPFPDESSACLSWEKVAPFLSLFFAFALALCSLLFAFLFFCFFAFLLFPCFFVFLFFFLFSFWNNRPITILVRS